MVLCGTSSTGEVLCAPCPAGYTGGGRVCTSTSAMDECGLGTHNCSPYATCTDTPAAYTCTCVGGRYGNGVTCQTGDYFDAGTPVRYRLSSLTIPTSEQAAAGDAVGHNVDQRGETCGVPDFVRYVDNSLIGLASALSTRDPDPIDLQGGIDTALNCPSAGTDCTPLDLFVDVRVGTNHVIWEVANGEGETLAGPFVGALGGDGNFHSLVFNLNLTIPYDSGTETVDLDLEFTTLIITGTVAADALTNMVIGGALTRTSLETTAMQLLAARGGDTTFDDIEPLLESRYDVQTDGQCAALSFGLTATATLDPP